MLDGGHSAQVVKSLRGEKLTINGKSRAQGAQEIQGRQVGYTCDVNQILIHVVSV